MATRVVLIDPNRNIREFCKRELERDGYDLLLCRTPEEAVRRMREDPIDVVVVDADAYIASAGTFAPMLRTLSIPVVLHDSSDGRACAQVDMAMLECVPKSGDLERLKRAIERSASRCPRT